MNKLEEYKIEKSAQTDDGIDDIYHHYKKGFDAAIALDLPVKFLEWCDYNVQDLKGFEPLKTHKGKTYRNEELYQYWIENIYKPE